MRSTLLPSLVLLLAACRDAGDKPDETAGGDDTAPLVDEEADADLDGYTVQDGDCDDRDAALNPGAAEACNGLDDDCNGEADDGVAVPTWYGDADGDGHGGTLEVAACEMPAGFVATDGDCDDGDAAAYPGAEEACTDEVDYNCDGSVGYADADGDGTPACEDCDDADATAFPGAVEVCDGADDDCDGTADDEAVDAPLWYADTDGDGYGLDGTTTASCEAPPASSVYGGDCDDADAAYHPGAPETCDVLVDYNCDGSVGGDDADGDGTQACEDCDDADATAFPGAAEACDGDDEDCDGEIDEAGATGEATWYADADGDTYGDAASTLTACDATTGYVADATDCDDTSGTISPSSVEVCDDADVDEDCDGAVDDGDRSVSAASEATWYIDYDGDGYGAASFTVGACDAPAGYVATADDCDDTDDTISPAGAEVCDDADADEDCDGASEDDDVSVTGRTTRYFDADGDGYGVASSSLWACDFRSTYVTNDDDCDDSTASVSPAGLETCDAADADEDCDGLADDADTFALGTASFYFDGDGDGYGDVAVAASSCDGGSGWIADASDCDDAELGDNPGATEIVGNEDDEDCDGGELCYADADADGYLPSSPGSVASGDLDCADSGEASATAPSGDCDDASATASPAVAETCNSADDDCDGSVDEGVGSTWYIDADGDGSGSASGTTTSCSLPTGYAATADDCDDGEPLSAPDLTEVCGDTIDNDCDPDPATCSFDGSYAATTHDLRMTGSASSDYMGRSVALGDFDGDGTGDLAGGAYLYDLPASGAGAAAIWYGPVTASGALGTADATLTGTASSAYLGYYAAAGDHDGDGADELIVGAYGVSSSAGAAYIVYGDATRRSGSAQASSASDVATLTGGTSSDYFGYNVGAGGDLDGDGMEEIVVGAYGQDGAASSAGAAYVLYGSSTRRSGSASATTAEATIRGNVASDYLGFAVSFVSDMDGDGLDELLVGAYGDDTAASSAGAAFLFLGDATRMSGTYAASAADARYTGVASSDNAGYGVYDLTDVTGDGYADAGVHGYGYDYGSTSSAGGLWVFGGGTTLSTTAVATLYGVTSSDNLGEEACSPGDQDGDGVNDLLVGGYGVDTAYTSAGAAFLWYGPVSGTLSASTADATFLGATTGDGYFGRRLPDQAGDVTGDGVDDIVVGAYWDDSYAYDAGSLYVWAGLGGE